MSRATVFQFRAGTSVFHRLDPMTKFAWLLSISLLAFGAYIAWIQILITLIVLFTAMVLARLSPGEMLAGNVAVPDRLHELLSDSDPHSAGKPEVVQHSR